MALRLMAGTDFLMTITITEFAINLMVLDLVSSTDDLSFNFSMSLTLHRATWSIIYSRFPLGSLTKYLLWSLNDLHFD